MTGPPQGGFLMPGMVGPSSLVRRQPEPLSQVEGKLQIADNFVDGYRGIVLRLCGNRRGGVAFVLVNS